MARRRPKAALGATLIGTLAITALLAAAVGVLFAAILSSSKGTGAAIQRRKTFYACDGISRGLAVLASDYFSEDDTPTDAELRVYITSRAGTNLAALTPAGYATPSFNMTIERSDSGLVPSGPFEGMSARIDTLTMNFETESTNGQSVCRIEESLSIGKIALFQFFAFSEYALDLGNCAPTTVTGRVHANGDFCGGCGGTNGKIERITASGRILKKNNCPRYSSGSAPIYFMDKSTGNWKELTTDATSVASWPDYAINEFHGNVQDMSHGVPELKVPFVARPAMQAGRNSQRQPHDNSDSMRFFVDPVPFGEDSSISEERLAWKADIRIIDGVWYKNDGTFPGTPIWSDHPGAARTYAVANGYVPININVGQADLFPGGSVPRLYSYYEYDATNQRLCEAAGSSANCANDAQDHKGVISYGTLHRKSTTPLEWVPGFWRFHLHYESGEIELVDDGPGDARRDPYCSVKDDGDINHDDGYIADASTFNCRYQDSAANWHDTEKGSNYLEGARSGFDDPRVHLGQNDAKHDRRGRMLPINFDVKMFTEAMQDTTPGELGSHFGGGADFNGVVWIGSNWDGQMHPTAQTLWPYNDDAEGHINLTDVAINVRSGDSGSRDLTPDGAKVQRALPQPLCSDSLGYDAGTATRVPYGGFNGRWDTTSGVTNISAFSIPKCNAGQTSIPNAVRLHNAQTISKAVFPKGLSIGTNLPGYMLGDLNTSSNVDANWVPFLFAADAITGMSNNWMDDRAPWQVGNSNVDVGASLRPARDTHWRAAMFFGHVWPVGSDSAAAGLQNWVRFVEHWGNNTYECKIDGSLVVGFSSVYENQTWAYSPVFRACTRTFTFDTKFNSIANQPPGAPTFTVSAVKDWKRN